MAHVARGVSEYVRVQRKREGQCRRGTVGGGARVRARVRHEGRPAATHLLQKGCSVASLGRAHRQRLRAEGSRDASAAPALVVVGTRRRLARAPRRRVGHSPPQQSRPSDRDYSSTAKARARVPIRSGLCAARPAEFARTAAVQVQRCAGWPAPSAPQFAAHVRRHLAAPPASKRACQYHDDALASAARARRCWPRRRAHTPLPLMTSTNGHHDSATGRRTAAVSVADPGLAQTSISGVASRT